MIANKKILVIGGTGSLGNALVKRYLHSNELFLYSRDESKHWKMNIEYQNHNNLKFVIGDIRDKSKLEQTLIRINPQIIILAAAMKHIDKCEYESNESIETNLIGTKNCLNVVEVNRKQLTDLECVLFVSTDKACSPVNIYGMCKAISESLMVEKSLYVPDIKFVTVRYGNVLNSNGSIIPMLHKIGNDTNISEFILTDERMTRFVMTLEQSVDLIEHAIQEAESGDIVIPKLISCNVLDLLEIFSEIYNKPVSRKGLRPGEKLLESLINETQSYRLVEGKDGYKYIKPSYKNLMLNNELKDYNSKINPLSKEELRKYLENLGLIEKTFLFQINENPEIYNSKFPYPHLVIDNILPEGFAKDLQQEILNIPKEEWDRYQNPFENKYTLRDKNKFPKHLSRLFGFLTSEHFVTHLSEIIGVKLYLDPTKNWWGVHTYDNGDFLDIHVDAGQHPVSHLKKHVTLGIYLSKEWKEENGGHLELWTGDSSVSNDAKIYDCKIKILPSFNRCVLFTCNDYSWHGNPNPVKIEKGESRIFVTISYTSDFQGLENFKNQRRKAFFVKRPNDPEDQEKDKLRILRADPDKYQEVYRVMN